MAIAWILPRRTVALRSIPRLYVAAKSMSTRPDQSQMDQPLYISTVDAEPLHRYQQGGYYPIVLGDYLKNRRYKVLHKLGWGGYSTVWAARDQRLYTFTLLMVPLADLKFGLFAEKAFMLLSKFLLQEGKMIGKCKSSK